MKLRHTGLSIAVLLVAASSALASGPDERVVPAPHDSPPHFFVELGGDFRNLASTDNLLILGIGSASAYGLSRFDHSIAGSSFFADVVDGTMQDRALEAGEVLGGGAVQGGSALALLGVGLLSSSPEVQELGSQLVRAQLVSFTITHALKASVARVRPDGMSRNSFPSGHTSSTFATAAVLQRRYGWKAGIPAFGLAGYVAASRMSEGRHYLSDVVFGAVVGVLAGRAVTVGGGNARFAVSPVFVPGGGGVHFTWLGPEPAS